MTFRLQSVKENNLLNIKKKLYKEMIKADKIINIFIFFKVVRK